MTRADDIRPYIPTDSFRRGECPHPPENYILRDDVGIVPYNLSSFAEQKP